MLTKIILDAASTKQKDHISFGQVMKITGVAVQGLPPSTNFTLKYSTGDDPSEMKDVLETPMVGGTTNGKRVCIELWSLSHITIPSCDEKNLKPFHSIAYD